MSLSGKLWSRELDISIQLADLTLLKQIVSESAFSLYTAYMTGNLFHQAGGSCAIVLK